MNGRNVIWGTREELGLLNLYIHKCNILIYSVIVFKYSKTVIRYFWYNVI